MQNSNLKFGAMPISYTSSNFSQKQHGDGLNPGEEVYKIWRKKFLALSSNHILSVGSFLAPPCRSRVGNWLCTLLTYVRLLVVFF